MKIVKVTYTVQADYIEQNKKNIRQVMSDLREGNYAGIKYSTYVKEDRQTFVHFGHFRNEEDNKVLTDLPAFQSFRQQLIESKPISPPNSETLELVNSCFDLF